MKKKKTLRKKNVLSLLLFVTFSLSGCSVLGIPIVEKEQKERVTQKSEEKTIEKPQEKKIDAAKLDTLFQAAEAIFAEKDAYEEEDVKNLETVYQKAKTLSQKNDLTQEEVDEAYGELLLAGKKVRRKTKVASSSEKIPQPPEASGETKPEESAEPAASSSVQKPIAYPATPSGIDVFDGVTFASFEKMVTARAEVTVYASNLIGAAEIGKIPAGTSVKALAIGTNEMLRVELSEGKVGFAKASLFYEAE